MKNSSYFVFAMILLFVIIVNWGLPVLDAKTRTEIETLVHRYFDTLKADNADLAYELLVPLDQGGVVSQKRNQDWMYLHKWKDEEIQIRSIRYFPKRMSTSYIVVTVNIKYPKSDSQGTAKIIMWKIEENWLIYNVSYY